MARNHVLASVLYELALSLKTMNWNTLNRKKSREKVIATLSLMQFLTHCIGMKRITNEQAENILSLLSGTYACDTSNIADSFGAASAETDYTDQYDALLFRMQLILSSCIKELTDRRKGYRENAKKYIIGFHNLPRAFLSLTDRRMISVNDALEYAKSYLTLI